MKTLKIKPVLKKYFLLISLLSTNFWCFSQSVLSNDGFIYNVNESIISDKPTLIKSDFQFIDLSNYEDVYLIETLGENTSIKFFLINDSVIKKLEFRFKNVNQYDFQIETIPKSTYKLEIVDTVNFALEVTSDYKNTSCISIKWLQHISNGKIISGLYIRCNRDDFLKKTTLPLIKPFIEKILWLDENI